MATDLSPIRKALGLGMSRGDAWVNPFLVTKAVHLTDDEIFRTYVVAKPVTDIASPTSPTPLLLTGGKGSGRTHLLRYWSHPVQSRRFNGDYGALIAGAEYVGFYILLGGLNSARFQSEHITAQANSALFGQHLDLAVASTVLRFLSQLRSQDLLEEGQARDFGAELLAILGITDELRTPAIDHLFYHVDRLRRTLDWEVNSAIVEGRAPTIELRSTPGELFLELPALVGGHFTLLREITISYLLDELENVGVAHQRHVQTLIREKRPGTAVIVGSRTYGVRTLETLAAGEANVDGAEFIEVKLDELMREPKERLFAEFCHGIARNRLNAVGLHAVDPIACFADGQDEESRFLATLDSRRVSPAMNRLRRSLKNVARLEADVIDAIEALLTDREDRLSEKLGILAFYKAWGKGTPSVEMAKLTADDIRQLRSGERNRLSRLMGHFRADLLAQLRREFGVRQSYAGFDTLVRIADGNPRNFVNLLRLVFTWAEFMECATPKEAALPVEAQTRAVMDASEWFYRDSEVVGEYASQVRIGINRLGELLEQLRFAEKVVESSLSTVTVDLDATTAAAESVIREAEAWSVLVRRPNRRDRNQGRKLRSLQINRMLAPRWNLPLGRRGILALRPEEVEAIFVQEDRVDFEEVLRRRLSRLNYGTEGVATRADSSYSVDKKDTLF